MKDIKFAAKTDVGRVRGNNEDTYIAKEIIKGELILLAAIDGMGGEEGGEVAAAIARDTIEAYVEKHSGESNRLSLIKEAVARANNAIVDDKEKEPKYDRMGCVATVGLIDVKEETMSVAHVGDSRLYRYSHGELIKVTHDHSLVGYQEEQGILSEEEAMHHPMRSTIERCLGAERHTADEKMFIEAGVYPLLSGELFLFCSDGLSDVITSAQIVAAIKAGNTPEKMCQNLIDSANEAGGKDNITVVIAKMPGVESPQYPSDAAVSPLPTAETPKKKPAAGKDIPRQRLPEEKQEDRDRDDYLRAPRHSHSHSTHSGRGSHRESHHSRRREGVSKKALIMFVAAALIIGLAGGFCVGMICGNHKLHEFKKELERQDEALKENIKERGDMDEMPDESETDLGIENDFEEEFYQEVRNGGMPGNDPEEYDRGLRPQDEGARQLQNNRRAGQLQTGGVGQSQKRGTAGRQPQTGEGRHNTGNPPETKQRNTGNTE